ncbi:MAG: hypothetical protein HY777_06960 [Betaproteobacteria bacterium]|nr:hypothetical protein [Betaproteobacteria bacterium]
MNSHDEPPTRQSMKRGGFCGSGLARDKRSHRGQARSCQAVTVKLWDNFVIPAKAGIQWRTTGFRVKPGMTALLKGVCFVLTARHVGSFQAVFRNQERRS